MRIRMSKFMRISADADPDAELRYTSNKYMLKMLLNTKYFLEMCLNTNYIDVFKYFCKYFFILFSKYRPYSFVPL